MPSSGSFAPQVPQNVPSWRFLAPQARQTFDRRSLAPQELQNKSSSRFIRPHDRQSIAPLPLRPRRSCTTAAENLDGWSGQRSRSQAVAARNTRRALRQANPQRRVEIECLGCHVVKRGGHIEAVDSE